MSKQRKAAEWQMGRLESGRPFYDDFGGGWTLDDPDYLYWVGLNGETLCAGKVLRASNTVFDGRPCVAALQRPLKKRGRTTATFFIEFSMHYISSASTERECRGMLDDESNPLDRSKPVLCECSEGIAVLPIYPCDPLWIAAGYALRSEMTFHAGADLSDPAIRVEVRRQLEASQLVRDRFLADPIAHRGDATCEVLISADGAAISWVEGCTFTGLVPTPTPAESLRLMGELDRLYP
jgi:hypothetical protein